MKSRCIMWIAVTALSLILVADIIYNIHCNKLFFETNLSSIITIAIGLYLAFLYSTINSAKNLKREAVVNLLDVFREISSDERCYILSDVSEEQVKMKKRQINNYVTILQKYKDDLGLKDEIDYIVKEFKEYEEIISDHSFEELKIMQTELQRPIMLIDGKINEIQIKMYMK